MQVMLNLSASRTGPLMGERRRSLYLKTLRDPAPSRVMKTGKKSKNRSNLEARERTILTPNVVCQQPARDANMASSYPRIIFMDLEGTLLRKAAHLDNRKVAPSAWTLLAERLGPDALREEEKSKDRWLKGEYRSYIEWMQDTIQIHKRFGLTASTFYDVMDSIETTTGAREVLETLRARRVITAIISGGFKALADRVQRSMLIDHSFAACDYFFDPSSGLLQHWNLLPTDYTIKVDFMRLIIKEYRVLRSRCVFVGDGPNDVWMAKEVGCAIAFNAHPDLMRTSTCSITQPEGQEDFRAVLEVIDSHFGTHRQREES